MYHKRKSIILRLENEGLKIRNDEMTGLAEPQGKLEISVLLGLKGNHVLPVLILEHRGERRVAFLLHLGGTLRFLV